jgi:hypothetical protein
MEMSAPAYRAARVVAPKLQEHFARHLAEAAQRGETDLASVPEIEAIERVIEAAFWTSLRREENYIPRISLAMLSPAQSAQPLLFDVGLPLEPGKLAKVAPAVERAGIHLGVWRNDLGSRDSVSSGNGGHGGNSRGLQVWGTTRSIPTFCIVVEVAAPGLIVVKHHRGEEAGKFVNVAVIEGDEVKMVDEKASSLPDCPALLRSLLGFDSPASWLDSVNVLVQLAVSMRAHGRGGLLLVVPASSEGWRESIVRPIPYSVVPPFDELTRLARAEVDDDQRQIWLESVEEAVDAMAGLTAVDGATIITTDYQLLAFGAKIARRKGSPQVEQVTLTEPIEGDVPQQVHPSMLGGTRHLSAAQFVHDQRDAIALVASQDGRFTVFAWSPCEDSVHAHRVETLLL